jgi:hypothetical protein
MNKILALCFTRTLEKTLAARKLLGLHKALFEKEWLITLATKTDKISFYQA